MGLPPTASGGCTYNGDAAGPGIQCWLNVPFMTKVNRGVKAAVHIGHVISRRRRRGGGEMLVDR